MMRKRILIYCIVMLMLVSYVSGEKTKKKDNKPISLFKSEELLEITLTQDVKTIKKDVKEDRDYHPGKLSYIDKSNKKTTLNVLIKTRGKTRRDPRICDFPPFIIKFNKKETKGTIFRKEKKLKLVTPCKRKIGRYQQSILKEYLVYKMLNILTKKSFRVRLLKINYIDSMSRIESFSKYGFFIESTKQLGKRMDGKEDETNMKFWTFQQKYDQILVSVFQFMIGNTDWSIPARHNVKIMRAPPNNSLYAVPYDFDMCGFVNAPYAEPHKKLKDKIQDVTTRLYRGLCRNQEEFNPVFARFNEKKKEIYAMIKGFTLLEEKHREKAITYLDEFYEVINTPKKVKRQILEECKKI